MNDSNIAPPIIKPMGVEQLTVGETYDSWLCASCQEVIALAPRDPMSDPFDLPDGVVKVICSYCQAIRPYSMRARHVRRYPWPRIERTSRSK